MAIRIFALISILFLPVYALAEEPNADEEAVWAMEETYWRYVENNDLEGYRSLWDERFVGWPGGAVAPVEKQNIANWVPLLHADPSQIFKYELKREAVRSFGDVVAVHYSVRGYWISADTGNDLDEWTEKFTHTWKRRGDSWQIITGMAGDYPPEE